MNSRQAAKAAGQRVMELERILALNKMDIIEYNLCILRMIDGESPCVLCEDYEECQLEAKDGKGCGEWMLRSNEKRKAQAAAAKEEAEKAGEPDAQGTEEGTDIDPVQCVEEQ